MAFYKVVFCEYPCMYLMFIKAKDFSGDSLIQFKQTLLELVNDVRTGDFILV